MYHLLVKSNGWAARSDTILGSRVFEHTSPSLVDSFKPGGEFDLKAVSSIPAIFMCETGGSGSQLARVGRIAGVSWAGRDIALKYEYDDAIRPIDNSVLQGISIELDIDDFEFARTHWAIKDVDLFRVLLRNPLPCRQAPTVFALPETQCIDENVVSVMMPFSPRFDPVFTAIKEVALEIGMQCQRADDMWEHREVMQDVVSLIDRSRIVVVDCTGRNPNVFYEAGIAHTLGRETVLITQSDEDVPFDLMHLRYVKYLSNSEGLEELRGKLIGRFRTIRNQFRL